MTDIKVYASNTLWFKEKIGEKLLAGAIKALWGKEIGPERVRLPKLSQDHIFIFAAVAEDQKLSGLGRLVLGETKSFEYGVVHDIIVDDEYRGEGISKKLMHEMIRFGKEKGLRYLELTCNPKREIANHLYQSIGFVCLAEAVKGEPSTNYYRYFFN